jgi:hypothetical protein
MMAATRARRRAAGELPEDHNKNPSPLLKEFLKINQKNKQKKAESVRQGEALEQIETTSKVTQDVDELPFVDVQPLPFVGRGQTKTNNVLDVENDVEKLLEIPKLNVEPGFKNRAPLQLDERAKDLVQEALKNVICISMEDFLNVSEPMRQELKKLLIKRRMEKKSVIMAEEVDPVVDDRPPEPVLMETISVDDLPEASYEVLAEDTNGMARGSVVFGDPVMQYLNTLAPGVIPKKVVVAAESQALRTVYPEINGVGKVESLLDAGSQIVSMSRDVATMLRVPWDPDITVHMESANKTLEKTLGLAKNIPFVFGPITVYLQVHVIERVAYKVLLGRPFDTITESQSNNYRDGSQTLTLTDLNTGEKCVMATHERGKPPTVLQRPVKQDFHRSSMN